MRRKRSDELPRFDGESESPPLTFRWRRRYAYFVLCFVALCWLLYPSRQALAKPDQTTSTNWSNYAYSLYATDTATLCHAVLVLDALARHGSKADRVLFFPAYWDTKVTSASDRDSQLLVIARDEYQAKLQPIKVLTAGSKTEGRWSGAWDKTVTKLMAFSLTYYDRVIALETDLTLLQSLDELFLLPKTPMAMPRAYWGDTKPWPLTTMLMVLQPNADEFETFKERIDGGGDHALVDAHKFDMELVNERFEENALVLPHRPYALVTSEFSRHDHADYLGSPTEEWDAEKVFSEAKLVHFSDDPLPPPWIMWPLEGLEKMQPDCGGSHDGSCAERRIWKHLYNDFRRRRHDICKLLSVQAPEWKKPHGHGQVQTSSATRERDSV